MFNEMDSGLNMLVERTFINRGYTKEFLNKISNPDHGVLANTDKLIDRLHYYYVTQQRVVVLPDYDMDGICSGCIGLAGLADMGFIVGLYRPEPQDGYGFNENTINAIRVMYPDVRAILTCDTGITCHDGVDRANAMGIEMFITDHHKPDKEGLPSASVIVDPMCEDPDNGGYAHQQICGAYVLYQVLNAYAVKYRSRHEVEQIRRLRVFAGIGTISDLMPLHYENRQLVIDAMKIAKLVYGSGSEFVLGYINGDLRYRCLFRGLYLVLKAFERTKKIKTASDINAVFFSFYVAPMFNSVKRVGMRGDMEKAFGVFFGATPESDVDYLMSLNEQRKVIVSDYFDRMSQVPQPYAPYVYISDAPGGVLGLLAQRQMGVTGNPCCVVTNVDRDDGSFHGSGRSKAWYPLLTRGRDAGFYIAGHEGAFGIGFKNVTEMRKFFGFITKDYYDVVSNTDMTVFEERPDFVIAHDGSGDTVIDIVTFLDYIEEMKHWEPFGVGFPQPRILLKFNAADGEWGFVGSTNQHVYVTLQYGFKVMLFNQADAIRFANTNTELCVMGSLSLNEWQGTRTVQFTGDLVEG